MYRTALLSFVAILLLAGCNRQPDDETAAADTAAESMGGMQGMQGMDMGGSRGMMQEMQAHMQMMEGAQGDSLRNMATMHRQRAANMLAQMNRDMQQMNMTADANWNALVDSVRQDLTRMPEWTSAEMNAAMVSHMSRMRRLMDMHEAMMKNM